MHSNFSGDNQCINYPQSTSLISDSSSYLFCYNRGECIAKAYNEPEIIAAA